MSREAYRIVREKMLQDLKRDLVGPEYIKNDVITEPPSQAYLTGILYPLESEVESQDDSLLDERLEAVSDDAEESVEEVVVESKNKTFKQQSSMGLRFYIKESIQNFNIKYTWGKYKKSKKYNEEKQKDIPIWVRNIESDVKTINIKKIQDKNEFEVSDNVYIVINKRKVKETNNYLVSVFISNRNVDKDSNNGMFQCELEVFHEGGDKIFLAENYARKDSNKFEEFLYRNKPIFAKGFGCAASWENNDDMFAGSIKTEFIPTHEVGSMSTELPEDEDMGSIPKGFFSIKRFSEENDKRVVIEKLNNLADRYENWINRLPVENVKDIESAESSINECRKVLKRIRSGILLLEDDKVFSAFTFMNKVMHTQISMKNYSKSNNTTSLEEELKKENFSWRPFQLAFILLNMEGVVNPKSADRTIVDLLWFPTGGGKTEAYLGIISFLLGYRRLLATDDQKYERDGGVTIFLRYTLRLLTTQQRDRLMRVISAAEYIRANEKEHKYGHAEFSVGFWVGGQVTANKFNELQETSYRKAYQVKNMYKNIEKQLLECPCCGTKNPKFQFLPDRNTKSEKTGLDIYCENSSCYFSSNHIPVYLIDEEIYRRVPSVIISTVDKFARLPWDEITGTLFGKIDRYCEKCGFIGEGEKHTAYHISPKASVSKVRNFYPPELIIQDELHLITGPLGTIYGGYETVIEELCTIKDEDNETIKPKYIAATATIKNAEQQVERVFGRRNMQQFPPPGLENEDSFFAREISVEDYPFRLYSGVCVSGQSMKTVLLRIYAVLLQSTENLLKDEELAKYVDPYRTLIGYFNSIRELGGAVRLLDDDVRKRIQTLQKKYGYKNQRYINRNDELTARVPSYKIPKVLELLERETGNNEYDVVLATNMISVGMDVDRLGLMVVTGQPKQTSEYIQASSRVGRSKPGLVITVYNPYRPRDMSHYQNFKGYHSRLYYFVEGTTATPYASRARDRVLHAITVALARMKEKELAQNEGAKNIGNIDLSVIKSIILDRVSIVEPNNVDGTIADLDEFLDEWIATSSLDKELLYYFSTMSKQAKFKKQNRLLRRYSEKELSKHERPTLDSMRQIEGSSRLYLYEGWENE
ncbi:DISARM system helicase DrmA [Sutcliffiella horikoshii]|uniref:DISARM system helicase DrmA n=1 Tax=Sutcliffiella horikoshii TaxID=79883 RepID=UPI001CBF3331|nr:DISARM system helicase DrmA [Sutcliffiella horikoshii]